MYVCVYVCNYIYERVCWDCAAIRFISIFVSYSLNIPRHRICSGLFLRTGKIEQLEDETRRESHFLRV